MFDIVEDMSVPIIVTTVVLVIGLSTATRLFSAARYPGSPDPGRTAIVWSVGQRIGPGTSVEQIAWGTAVDVAAPGLDDAPDTRFRYRRPAHAEFADVVTTSGRPSAQMVLLLSQLYRSARR